MPPVVWTPERDDALGRLYAEMRPGTPAATLGQMWIAIWQKLNGMPGRRISTPQAVRSRYFDVVQDTLVTSPESAPVGDARARDQVSSLKAPHVAFCGVHVVVSYNYAKSWAEKYGLSLKRMGLDLRTVNAVRRRAGAAPFVLQGSVDG